jgi:hypothetical protein
MEVTKPLIPQQLWLESFDAVLRLSHNGGLYANPVPLRVLMASPSPRPNGSSSTRSPRTTSPSTGSPKA